MSTRLVGMGIVATSLLLALQAIPAAPVNAAEGETISVELKSFKFKVAPQLVDLFGYNDGDDKLFFYAAGPAEATVKLPATGDYEIVIRASCDPALGERAKFKM